MGLDIYIRKCADLAAATAAEEACEAATSALWPDGVKYEDVPEATKEEIRAKTKDLEQEFGLVDYRHGSIQEIEEPSKIDSEHIFKLGYFRSSYNGSGIERILGKLGLPTLHDIFTPGDEYQFTPDWNAALVRATAAVEGYAAHLASDMGRFQVMELRPMFEYGVSSEEDALKLFAKTMRENSERDAGWRSFSNRDGAYYLDGLTVRAFITKTYIPSARGDMVGALINRPSTFVIYDRDIEEGKEDWHLTALRIVKEAIEYVLAQPDKQHFYMTWSG